MYVQIVFDQSVKTFIEYHKNAFKYFGGIPKTVKIDNLSYMEFFELLINDEVLNKQNNSNKNRIRKAKFAQHKTLEEYNFNYKPTTLQLVNLCAKKKILPL